MSWSRGDRLLEPVVCDELVNLGEGRQLEQGVGVVSRDQEKEEWGLEEKEK